MRIGLIIVGSVVVLLLTIFGFIFFLPTRFYTDIPISIDVVHKHLDVVIPAGATEVYVATYAQGVAYSKYIRFHASLQTCASYLESQVSRIRSACPLVENVTTNMISAGEIIRRPDIYTCPFTNGVPWFDVDNITNGTEIRFSPMSGFPVMYVDKTRELFFYVESD